MAKRSREYKDVIGVSGIRETVNETLALYSDLITQQIDEIEEAIAKKSVKKLRLAGSFEDRRSRGYRKTWKAKKRDDLGGWIVYNYPNYSLTHLLEKGHALRSGGRSLGSTRAFPHIKKVEEEVIKEFEKEVREVIKG